jgi:anaerobic selenocysteine-containing dehydrogenase
MVHAEVDPLTGAARDSVLISDTDADRLGLAEGAPVLVRSGHGELRAQVHRAPLRPGNVQVFYPEGNVLLPGGHRDRSGVPDYNTTVELVPQ